MKLYRRYLYGIATFPFVHAYFFVFSFYIIFSFFSENFFHNPTSECFHMFFTFVPKSCVLFLPCFYAFSNVSNEERFPCGKICIGLSRIFAVFTVVFANIVFSFAVSVLVARRFCDIDAREALTGFLGTVLFLFSATCFVRSCFRICIKVIPSFLLSYAGLLVVNSIHLLPVYFDIPQSCAVVMQFISFAYNFNLFSKGIVDAGDVLYFMTSSFFFFFLAVFADELRKGNRSSFFKKIARMGAVTAILLFVISESVRLRIDFSKNKAFSVSDYSRNLISGVDEKLKISYFVSPRLKKAYPQVRDIEDYIMSYASYSPNICYGQVNPTKPSEEQRLRDFGISGEKIKMSSYSEETTAVVFSSIVLEYSGCFECIPFVLDVSSLEYELDRRVKNLLEDRRPRVQLCAANGLSLETDYKFLADYLESRGYVVFKTCLPSEKNEENISFDMIGNVPLIILGSLNYTKTDLDILEKYVLDGNKTFIASQGYSVNLEEDWKITSCYSQKLFERFLFTFGIYPMDSVTCSFQNASLTLQGDENSETVEYPFWCRANDGKRNLTMFWPQSFEIDEDVASLASVKTEPLLYAGNGSWQQKSIDGEYDTNPFLFKWQDVDEKSLQRYPLASCISIGGGDVSAIYFADQYAFDSRMISYASSGKIDLGSLEFLHDSLMVLDGQNELLQIKNKSIFKNKSRSLKYGEYVSSMSSGFILMILAPFICNFILFIIKIFLRKRIFNEKI